LTFHELDETTKELNKQIDGIFFKHNHPMIYFLKNNWCSIFVGFILGILIQIGAKIWF
jgi:hypothetical protein